MDADNAMPSPGAEILVVEDSPTQAEQLRYLLEAEGYRVWVAGNGLEALEALQAWMPQLVISDVVMPGMDGFALCRAIKQDARLKALPVVMVTSLSSVQDLARSLECGADNLVCKPYEPRALLARVEYVLVNRRLREAGGAGTGMEFRLDGARHQVTSEPRQLMDILVSTYEEAVRMNEELQARQTAIAQSRGSLACLFRVADELNRAGTEAEVVQKAVDVTMDLPRLSAAWICLAGEQEACRVAASSTPTPDLGGAAECSCLPALLCRGGWLGGGTFSCDRLGPEAAGRHLGLPLRVGERCLGVLNLLALPGESFDGEDLKIFDAIGSQVAVALERARLLAHLESMVELRTAALAAEVAERTRAQARVSSLNRTYAVLSGINSVIVRIHDRLKLFQEACRIVVEHGGFGMCWIGEAVDGEIRPLAWAGMEGDIGLVPVPLEGADRTHIVAESWRRLVPVSLDDLAEGEVLGARHVEARRRGYRSVIALPLVVGNRATAVLVIYAAEANFFRGEERQLLTELAGDVSFTLEYIDKQERLAYLAYHDVLTGLPNRALLVERTEAALRDAQKRGAKRAVLVFDVKRFRNINDTLGRQTGDAVLRELAERLRNAWPEPNRIARLSSDDFGAMLGDRDDLTDIGHQLEHGLAALFDAPFLFDGHELRLSGAAGVAVYPEDGETAEDLFRNAEAAMHKAKASGLRYTFYRPAMNAMIADAMMMENRLQRALQRGEFVLYYQPKVDLTSRKTVGFEALIRWNEPELGLILPDNFIPLLEDTGLIVEIGDWVIRQALADVGQWRSEGLDLPGIAVNVSSVQLRQKGFLDKLKHTLGAGSGISGIDLELTESAILTDYDHNLGCLTAIRDMGVKIAIDDFGTGYSSLSYLTRLPVTSLKIDRSFIVTMTSSPESMAIVQAIITLAHALGLTVIAEGVETEEQAKMLRLLKCHEYQGFLRSPAVPADRVAEFL